jgi:hypothetical protein
LTIGDRSTGAPLRRVVGRGTYQLGGEVAVTQRLELDLRLTGEPPAHFDSGLVPAGAQFPEIEATVSRNGMTCFDEVLAIDAVPVTVTATPR